MVKVDPKNTNLVIEQNFNAIVKIDTRFGICDPKLINVDYFQTRYTFAVYKCYIREEG